MPCWSGPSRRSRIHVCSNVSTPCAGAPRASRSAKEGRTWRRRDYYKETLGLECLGTWHDPPVYAIVARDQQAIYFRLAHPPAPNPEKVADELLDAYVFIEDADALYAEYATRGVEFTRGLADMPWHSREFVVKDDGRLLALGSNSVRKDGGRSMSAR